MLIKISPERVKIVRSERATLFLSFFFFLLRVNTEIRVANDNSERVKVYIVSNNTIEKLKLFFFLSSFCGLKKRLDRQKSEEGKITVRLSLAWTRTIYFSFVRSDGISGKVSFYIQVQLVHD